MVFLEFKNFYFPYSDRIEEFIDENKALMRRMYGDFRTRDPISSTDEPPTRRKRNTKLYENIPGVPDITAPFDADLNLIAADGSYASGESYFGHWRSKRQTKPNKLNPSSSKPNPGSNPSTEPSSGRFV